LVGNVTTTSCVRGARLFLTPQFRQEFFPVKTGCKTFYKTIAYKNVLRNRLTAMPALEKSRCQASSQDVVFTESAQDAHRLCTGDQNSSDLVPLKSIFQP
jgi:hypothetical protein